MEGRFPQGVLIVLSDCNDQGQEREFNTWYDRVHIPDTAVGALTHVSRYANVQNDPQLPRYMAIYETAAAKLERVLPWFRAVQRDLGEKGRIHNAMAEAFVGMYEKIGKDFVANPGKKCIGLQAMFSDCRDESREKEFNRWYDNIHIPDVLGTGAYHTAYRYRSLDANSRFGKFLALYETDKNPDAAAEAVRSIAPQWRAQGRLSELAEPRLRLLLAEVFSFDADRSHDTQDNLRAE